MKRRRFDPAITKSIAELTFIARAFKLDSRPRLPRAADATVCQNALAKLSNAVSMCVSRTSVREREIRKGRRAREGDEIAEPATGVDVP